MIRVILPMFLIQIIATVAVLLAADVMVASGAVVISSWLSYLVGRRGRKS